MGFNQHRRQDIYGKYDANVTKYVVTLETIPSPPVIDSSHALQTQIRSAISSSQILRTVDDTLNQSKQNLSIYGGE